MMLEPSTEPSQGVGVAVAALVRDDVGTSVSQLVPSVATDTSIHTGAPGIPKLNRSVDDSMEQGGT